MDVHLYIERLIVDGIQLDPRQRRQLETAVKGELVRLLAEGGLEDELRADSQHYWQQASPIPLTAVTNPDRLGLQIAQVVYRGLAPGGDSENPSGG